MQTSNSFWNVCQQYFSESAVLVLFVIALIVLTRDWNREKKIGAFLFGCASMLLLYNELTYRVLVMLGEGSTYYRFFWIMPIMLLVACLVVKIFFSLDVKKRAGLALLLGVAIAFFSARQASDWLHFPENVYQMDEDVMQVADALMEVTGGEPTYLFDNGDLEETIRQYDARVMFTRSEVLPLDAITEGLTTNLLGKDVQEAIRENHCRYIALNKLEKLVCKVMESAGLSLVSETDNYYIYRVDNILLYDDESKCRKLAEGFGKQVNVEYIPISGLNEEYEYIYLSDLGAYEDEETYMQLIDKISLRNPTGVIINDRLSENANWQEKYKETLDGLQIPYYCNNQEIQLIEQGEFNICLLDNTVEIMGVTLQELQEVLNGTEPVILVLSSRLEPEMTELYTIVAESASTVRVLSAQKSEYEKELIGESVLQFATPVDENQIFNMVRIKRLEEENE